MYFCPKSLCDERSYARHACYFAASDSLRSDTPSSYDTYLSAFPKYHLVGLCIVEVDGNSISARLAEKWFIWARKAFFTEVSSALGVMCRGHGVSCMLFILKE
jgi:hypothetical protein